MFITIYSKNYQFDNHMNVIDMQISKPILILNREFQNEINEIPLDNEIYQILYESFMKYPRNYVFSKLNKFDEKIEKNVFEDLIENLLSEQYPNKLNFVLIKKIVVSHKLPLNYLENYHPWSVGTICMFEENILQDVQKKMNIFEPDGHSIISLYQINYC